MLIYQNNIISLIFFPEFSEDFLNDDRNLLCLISQRVRHQSVTFFSTGINPRVCNIQTITIHLIQNYNNINTAIFSTLFFNLLFFLQLKNIKY